MKIINSLSELSLDNSVVALGTFDGLHLGHKSIVEKALELARAKACPAVVFSFSSHPLELLNPELAPSLLLTYEEKAEALRHMGVDILVSIRFDKELAEISAQEFANILCSKACPQAIVVGENFTYGKKGRGNPELLLEECTARGIELQILPLLHVDNLQASSSRIRQLVMQGDIQTANRLLGRLYCLSGQVVQGSQIGRTIGFPTANINLAATRLAIPAVGGYIVSVKYQDRIYKGIANIGFNPTVGSLKEKRLEVHLLDFQGDLYGQELSVCFHKYLCAEQKFANLDELKAHIARQKALAEAYFADKN